MGQHEKSRVGESNLAYELTRISQDVAAVIADRMDDLQLSQADLARSIGASTGRVLKVLSGDEFLTLRSLAVLATAVGGHFEITFVQDSCPRGNGDRLPTYTTQPDHSQPSSLPLSRVPSVMR
jgi:hypothetical protein